MTETMTETTLKEHLKEIVVKALGGNVEVADIQDGRLLKELGGDSIAALDVITALENEFGVKIHDQETAEKVLETINSLADYVEANRVKEGS